MARRSTDPSIDLNRILADRRKQPPKARWRVMITSDPSRPVRTFTLPRLVPALASLFAILLVVATVLLASGVWKLSGSLGALERRARAMMQAADSVALAGNDGAPSGDLAAVASVRIGKVASGGIGKFTIESVNNGETIEVRINLATGEV